MRSKVNDLNKVQLGIVPSVMAKSKLEPLAFRDRAKPIRGVMLALGSVVVPLITIGIGVLIPDMTGRVISCAFLLFFAAVLIAVNGVIDMFAKAFLAGKQKGPRSLTEELETRGQELPPSFKLLSVLMWVSSPVFCFFGTRSNIGDLLWAASFGVAVAAIVVKGVVTGMLEAKAKKTAASE